MDNLLPAIFLLSFIAIWPLAIAYFLALHKFGQILQTAHPAMIDGFKAKETLPRTPLNRSYVIFRAIEARQPLAEPLSIGVMAQYKTVRALLYCTAAVFLLLLFSGLGQEFFV